MQKFSLKIILAILVLCTISCQKDFLEETPQDQISNADFWKSANDIRLYANNFYNNYLKQYRGYGTIGPYGLDADQGSDNMLGVDYNTMLNGERTVPASGGGWSWEDIRNVNYFLVNYKKSTEDFEVIKKYVGEALFFKSLLYFRKVKTFGDVPWYDKPLTTEDTEELLKPRMSRHQVIEKVLADLDEAIGYLPSASEGEAFRINKQIAQALQARIALFEGTWEKYHAGTPFGVKGADGTLFLQKAASASQAIIESGFYSLDNVGVDFGYWKLFNQTDYSGSNEIMFWRKFNPDAGLWTHWSYYTKRGSMRGLTKSVVDYYLDINGDPISSSSVYQGDATLQDVVANRDPRLNQTIRVNDGEHFISEGIPFEHPAFVGPTEFKTVTGYQLYKGHSIDPEQQETGNGSIGVIYFRYAEVLLINAEAKATLETITQQDVDMTINKLRNRVGMPNLVIGGIVADPNWTFPELSPILNEVRRERRVELAAEGYRHDDIWRWAAADEVIVGWEPKGAKRAQWSALMTASIKAEYPVDAEGYLEPFQDALSGGYQFKIGRDYLSPIPTEELTLNENLAQNPGW